MKINSFLRVGALWLAMLGIALPNAVLGATPHAAVHDVKLNYTGELHGRILQTSGQPVANQTVQIHRNGQLIANAATDVNGQFVAANLSNGVYQVVSGGVQRTYRVWDRQSAPPIAQDYAVQTAGEEIVRGQGGGGIIAGIMSRPALVAMAVAVAVAVPIALDDDDAS